MAKKKQVSSSQKLGIGVGLTAAAVTAAGAYFLYGSKDAKKNRKKVKSAALKAKAEVLEVLEDAQDITEEEFHELVDTVIGTYDKAKALSKKDVAEFKKEMRDNWQDLVASGAAKVVTVERMAKKMAKKAKKRAAKKSPKKKAKKVTKKVAKKSAKKKK